MIHYIGFYYDLSSCHKKNASPALVTKMKYVAKKLAEIDGHLKVFSPAYSLEETAEFMPVHNYSIDSKIEVCEAATFGRKNTFFRVLSFLFSHFQLLRYLFFEIKKNDIVVLYHTLFYRYDILLFRFFKSNKVVIEVEELFSAVWGNIESNKEIKYLSKFDGYIYVNDIMNERFCFNKPYAVCYGNYDISSNYYIRDQYKKLIYAGVLGKEGTDVDLAIDLMKYLPDTYNLKIAGYGSEDAVSYIKNRIRDKENIEFVGFLSGDEYEEFLSKGDFGLCTRVLSNESSDYTFPSKVLVYLSHGLVPVCPSIDCLKKSKISEAIVFYKESKPENVALSINGYDKRGSSIQTIRDLDISFQESLAFVVNRLK